MNVMALFAAPVLLLATSAASAQAPAQSPAQSHDHQASSQQRRAEGRCCCEEMMRKMMSEMMQKQGMGMAKAKPAADGQPPAAPEHQH